MKKISLAFKPQPDTGLRAIDVSEKGVLILTDKDGDMIELQPRDVGHLLVVLQDIQEKLARNGLVSKYAHYIPPGGFSIGGDKGTEVFSPDGKKSYSVTYGTGANAQIVGPPEEVWGPLEGERKSRLWG